MKIAVLGGGNSPEREVSLRSAKSVAEAAKQASFDVVEIDPAEGYEQLDGLKDCVVLPILHGKNGEDGIVQHELEKRGLAYLGTGSDASKNCFDKWRTRQMLEENNIPMPTAQLVTRETYQNNPIAAKPHVLKILHGGSSIGTFIVRDPGKIDRQKVSQIFDMEKEAMVEELVEGNEITVPVLDKNALPVIEIRPPAEKEFDYENKYNGATAELCPPENISVDIQDKARAMAEKVHKVMNARHLSRVDMMIDKAGNVYVLEINTMPGMTDQSLYPKSARVAGYPMPKLIKKFIDLVKRDFYL